MKKVLGLLLLGIIAIFGAYYAFVYFVPYSEGIRSGELIKISHKGVAIKTWEGEISQGVSGAQIFEFSVLDKDQEVIQKLQDYQDDVESISNFITYVDLVYSKALIRKIRKWRCR